VRSAGRLEGIGFIPLSALALGFVFFGVEWSTGDVTRRLDELAIMAGVGAIFAFGASPTRAAATRRSRI
jgi:hypothetical protein